ncbi:helix-turn-helix domain-containing protein [Arabiibacter massiliensis]|uniref:helix-turn-helix domain-containing protein n=1 Tax=Arabiibacter massiliensis TaxID=1870985 RepID=UPI0009BA9466|nr:helix-turn-helix transcriptional regulator [Arabiibacter massiliensis]
MEIGRHIKRHRTERGLSQDDLAAKIYVSRQTISSWENDKTYPDIESLLLLSVLFDVTVDELIKGDMEMMKEAIEQDRKKMDAFALVMMGFGTAALVMFFGGMFFWHWDLVPTTIIALLLWGVCMAAAVMIDRLKKQNDVVTYRELVAFSKGEPIERDNPKSQRARQHRLAKNVAKTVAALAIGAAIGLLAYQLFG